MKFTNRTILLLGCILLLEGAVCFQAFHISPQSKHIFYDTMVAFFITLALLLLSIHDDWTRIKQEKNDESQVSVKELEEMRLDFVSMAAHELRTPLTAIRGYTSLIQMQYEKKLDDPGKELLTRLNISGENLSNLIDNLLE